VVGPTEIAAVMYPAMLEAPPRSEHADLYVWATAHAMARKNGTSLAEFYKTMGMRPIEDSEVLDRRGRLHDAYRRLSEDIRRKVIRAQAERERDGKRAAAEEAAAQPRTVQQSLFDMLQETT